MSLEVDINSYVTLLEAEQYLSDRYGFSTWYDSEYQESALVTAARLLDTQLSWLGTKYVSTQVMQWPRSGFDELDETVVPQIIKDAQCELAYDIVENQGLKSGYQSSDDLKRIKADTVELEYKSQGVQKISNSRIPDHIRTMVKPYISGTRVIRLARA